MHNTASPAAGDVVGQLRYSGKDSAGNTELYSKIETRIDSPTSGSESSDLRFSTRSSGAYAERLKIDSDGKVDVIGGYIARNPSDSFTLNGVNTPHYGFQLNASSSVPVALSLIHI